MGNHTIAALRKVVTNSAAFRGMVDAGQNLVRQNYTTAKFSSCVLNNILEAQVRWQEAGGDVVKNYTKESVDENIRALKSVVAKGLAIERYHRLWNRNAVRQAVENLVTTGIKTYMVGQCRCPFTQLHTQRLIQPIYLRVVPSILLYG